MLVFSRKVGERIVINGNIVVEVLEIKRDLNGYPYKVILGLTAPQEVRIERGPSGPRHVSTPSH